LLVYEAIAERLSDLGVRALFGLPASETMRLGVAAEQLGIPHYAARHEQVAVGMADGYARSTGGVGVVLTGRGPGLTNGVNAMITAAKASTPLLVIAGETTAALAGDPVAASRHIMSVKTIDQAAFLRSFGVIPVVLDSAASALSDFTAAYELAASGSAVAVLIRGDVAVSQAGHQPSCVELPKPNTKDGVAPAAEDIGLLTALLDETWAVRRPVVLAGRGVLDGDAAIDLVRIADAIGAVLGTTLTAKSLFAGHPFDIGVIGMLSTPIASDLVIRSDLVLAFGASLNQYTSYGGDLFRSTKIVQVDARDDAIGKFQSVDLGIVADAGLTAALLADDLKNREHSSPGYRTPELAAEIAGFRFGDTFSDEGAPGALDPRFLALALQELLPKEKVVVFDNGAHISIAAKYLSTSDPGSFLLTHDYGSVGSGMGIALGAAVARKGETVLLAIGDGGFMMTASDIETASRYRLPVVVAVFNDGALAAEAHQLRMAGLPDGFARFGAPRLDDVARSLGGVGIRVESYADLEGIGDQVAALDGPLVLDCRTTMDVRGDHVELVNRLGHPQAAAARAD
jgi:thiamine pyrophosphate-dependent acetolactate synthase large subunit-like protein